MEENKVYVLKESGNSIKGVFTSMSKVEECLKQLFEEDGEEWTKEWSDELYEYKSVDNLIVDEVELNTLV